MNSIDGILGDKVLMKTQLDLQNTVPDIPCVSQMLGGPSLRHGIPKERLSIPSGIGRGGNDTGRLAGIGRGGNDTGRLVTWEFPLRIDSAEVFRIVHTIYFIFLILDEFSSCHSIEGRTLKFP